MRRGDASLFVAVATRLAREPNAIKIGRIAAQFGLTPACDRARLPLSIGNEDDEATTAGDGGPGHGFLRHRRALLSQETGVEHG